VLFRLPCADDAICRSSIMIALASWTVDVVGLRLFRLFASLMSQDLVLS
jgi:hypothetical protein